MMMILLNTALRNDDCKGNERIKLNFRRKAQQTGDTHREGGKVYVECPGMGCSDNFVAFNSIRVELSLRTLRFKKKFFQ